MDRYASSTPVVGVHDTDNALPTLPSLPYHWTGEPLKRVIYIFLQRTIIQAAHKRHKLI